MEDATAVLFDLPGFVVIECVEFDDGVRRGRFHASCGRARLSVLRCGGRRQAGRCARVADQGCAVRGAAVDRDRAQAPLPLPGATLPAAGCSSNAAIRSGPGAARVSGCAAHCPAPTPSAARTLESRPITGCWGGWVNDVAVRAAAQLPPEPPPVRWLGTDEIRTRRPSWRQDPDTGAWRREEPWMTSLTTLDTTSGRVIVGLTPGRSPKTGLHLARGSRSGVA